MFILLVIVGLCLSVEGINVSFNVNNNVKMKLNITNSFSCYVVNNCSIKTEVCTSDRCFISPFDVNITDYKQDIKISSDLSYTRENYTTINDKIITHLNAKIECQGDDLYSNCTIKNLCNKIPPGMCKNNGTCKQINSNITCDCGDHFQGAFCEEKKNPCQENLCNKNSTCKELKTNTGNQYSCVCQPGFQGRYCNIDVDECLNNKICSNFQNSTCINTYGSYICLCGNLCHTMTTIAPSSTKPYSIKWPLPDLATLLLVSLEGAVILMLILVLIFVQIKHCPMRRKKAKFIHDDNYSFSKINKPKKERIEFESNYARPAMIVEEGLSSLGPIYDVHELDQPLNLNSQGMSTFGRR